MGVAQSRFKIAGTVLGVVLAYVLATCILTAILVVARRVEIGNWPYVAIGIAVVALIGFGIRRWL
jgi:hypothetical protein